MEPDENLTQNVDNNPMRIFERKLTCSICQELFIKAVSLPCQHIFCSYCVTKWFTLKMRCPNCRIPATTRFDVRLVDQLIDELVQQLPEDIREKRKELCESRKVEQALFDASHSDPILRGRKKIVIQATKKGQQVMIRQVITTDPKATIKWNGVNICVLGDNIITRTQLVREIEVTQYQAKRARLQELKTFRKEKIAVYQEKILMTEQSRIDMDAAISAARCAHLQAKQARRVARRARLHFRNIRDFVREAANEVRETINEEMNPQETYALVQLRNPYSGALIDDDISTDESISDDDDDIANEF